tara:strand:- start:15444 stop:17240 length:1797 start_codon:yes stop_codon:yes gene_type:complete
MEINKGTSAALLGIFSSDRKAAKARELNIAQTQYQMSQQKQQQQYQLSQTLAQNRQAAQKIAASVTTRKADAQNLVTNMDSVIDEMKAGVAKYGGNVMRYMTAEGNDKWTSAIGDYEAKIGEIKTNEAEIAKYYELTNSDKAHLVMDKDTRALESYIDGTTNSFRYSGQIQDIGNYQSAVSSGREVLPSDVLAGDEGKNQQIIISNYMREYGITDRSQVTQANLEQYVSLKYLNNQPGLMGTKEDDRTVGGELLQSAQTLQKVNLNDTNPFSANASENIFSVVESELGRHGYTKKAKPETKRGVSVVGSGRVYENYEDKITKSVFGSENKMLKNVESMGLFKQSDGSQIEDTQWYGETLGGESEAYDLEVTGYHYAYKYIIDGKEQLAVMTDDPAKNEELRKNYESSGAKPSMVMVAQLREDDPVRDDYYYKEIQMSESLASEISSEADFKIISNEASDRKNQSAHKDNKRKNKEQSIVNISTNHFDGNDVFVEQTQSEAANTLLPVFKRHGVTNSMFTPLLSSLMAQSSSTSDLFSRIDLIDQALSDKNSEVGKALLTNNISEFNGFVKNSLNSQQEINEFQQLQNDWNQLNANSQY